MGDRRVGWALVVLGAAFFAVSLLAEPLQLGNDDGFGLKQIGGMVVGGALLVVGLALVYARRGTATATQAEV